MFRTYYLFTSTCTYLLILSGCTGNSDQLHSSSQFEKYLIYAKGDTSTIELRYNSDNKILSYDCAEDDEFITFNYDKKDRLQRIVTFDGSELQEMDIYYSEMGYPVSANISLKNSSKDSLISRKFIDYEVKNGKVIRMRVLMTGGLEYWVNVDYDGDDIKSMTLSGNAGYVTNYFEFDNRNYPKVKRKLKYVLNPELPMILYAEKVIIGHKIKLSEGIVVSMELNSCFAGNDSFIKESLARILNT